MLMLRKSLVLSCVLVIMATSACSKQQLSERDARRNQLRNQAELKRQELQQIAGAYAGKLEQSVGPSQNALLHLEVKDIPTQIDNQVDPVMTPVLSGFLRFYFGDPASNEYIGFSVQKAEFDPKRKVLDLVVDNSSYKNIILSLQEENSELTGSWTAPSVGTSGTVKFAKSQSGMVTPELGGEYGGVLERQGDIFQWGRLTVNTSFVPPEGLKITATLRVIFGSWESPEYLTYEYPKVDFNPITGQFVLKDENAEVSFLGYVSDQGITGSWFSSYVGKMGTAHFDQDQLPPSAPNGQDIHPVLKGTYQGKIVNTNPGSNLPERIQFSFVTSQDLKQNNGIQVTGSLRLYLGDFGSLEYEEMTFAKVEYNFFSGVLVAKTGGKYKLTIKANVRDAEINGTINEDALGEVGIVEAVQTW